ncbi:hypothetical protein DOY81_010279 [Sarcophaga bullata]|nr:hypothetical protein DOY81_010279 [Sarcophaga bullata]
MDKTTALRKILLVYDKKNEHFEKRKKHNLLILQNLLRQQLLLLTLLEENATKKSLWKVSHQSRFWEVNCHCNDDLFFKTHFLMTRASFD